MKKSGKNIFIVLFLLCISGTIFPLYPQKDDIVFEHLSMKEGLSMNPVMSIVQDKKGFLWFGTQDGLNRYDGYKFIVYKTKDGDSASISDNFITSQVVDMNGNLWVGTHTGGINKYNSTTGKFKRFSPISLSYGLNNNRIWSFFEDQIH